MMSNFIAKEGFKSIYISLAVAIFSYLFICDTLAIIAFLVSLFLIFVYRNNLITKAATDSLVSVVDGKVFAIDKNEESTSVYIEDTLCNSHTLVAPKDSHFKKVYQKHGLNLPQFSYKAKELNSKTILSFDDINVELYAGKCNISHDIINDCEVKQYDKITVFINGVVKLIIPNSYNLNLKLGQKLKAGETL